MLRRWSALFPILQTPDAGHGFRRFRAPPRSCAPLPALFLLLFLLSPGCERTTRDTDIRVVRLSEVRSLMDRRDRTDPDALLLIDPRSERRFNQAHIPGARNLRLPQVDPARDRDPGIERFRTIIVYGDDPASAAARAMTKRLLAAGYRGVRLYAGGIKEWVGRGYETAGTGDPASQGAPPTPTPTPSPTPTTSPSAPESR